MSPTTSSATPPTSSVAQAPAVHDAFSKRFPKLAEAWSLLGEAGREGPLDDKTVRLVKLATAIAAGREGAVHASVRKALAMGLGRAELEQVVAIVAGTIGMPAAVAAYTWINDAQGGPVL